MDGEEGSSDERKGLFDPVQDALTEMKSGAKPEFLKDKEKEGGFYHKNKSDNAANSLKSAEGSAVSGGLGKAMNGLAGAREKENKSIVPSSNSGMTNSVNGMEGGSNNKKGILKKGGPVVLIGVVFALIAVFMMGGQNIMPIAIKEMITEKFNSVGTSSTVASDSWLNLQLNKGVRLGKIDKNSSENLYAFSEYQVEQLEKQGILVVGTGETESETTQTTALLYRKGDMYIPVVGSNALDYENNGSTEDQLKLAIANGAAEAGHGILLDQIGRPISAKEALADSDFKTPYTTASKSWRGGSSGWFDNIMGDITQIKLGITRNRWSSYVRRAAKGVSNEFKKIAKSPNLSKTSDGGVEADVTVKEDSDAEPTTKPIEKVEVDGDSSSQELDVTNNQVKKIESADETPQVESSLKSKSLKAAAAVGDAANYGCALLEGLVSIYSLVSAYQSLQFLNLTSGFLESVDKIKAGDDQSSPIHEYSVNLTTKSDTMYDGKVVEGHKDRTAMESAGMSWLFGKQTTVNASDPSVKNVNFENIMSSTSDLFKDIGNKMEIYNQCGYVRAGAAVVDLVVTAVSFIPIVGGGIKAIQMGGKELAKAAITVAVQIALYAVIPIAAKNLAKMMIKDAATDWLGEDLGNAVVSGANKYLGGNGTSGGQSPGSTEKVIAYLGARDEVIAEEGKYQRAIKSPFDISSRHTFLGSLAYSIIPLAYSNGLTANIASMSSLVSSSAIAMLPTASAIDENSVLNSKGSCDLLTSVGAVGDAFCNSYIITDMSTIDTSPIAVNDIVHRIGGDTEVASVDSTVAGMGDNFNSDGSINKSSDLAKYITYCGQRTSQYGIKDATIAAQLSGEDTTVAKIMNFVPVLNDVTSIYTGINAQINLGWSTGSACVASDENSYWEDNKWYQRYAEDQRLLENMNPGYTSTVTAYLQDYYKENPIDQSLEGTLARFTGMTKEKVEDTFALIEYFEFLDEYNAEERYAFGESKVKMEEELDLGKGNEIGKKVWGILLNQISYADVRNRSFAI